MGTCKCREKQNEEETGDMIHPIEESKTNMTSNMGPMMAKTVESTNVFLQKNNHNRNNNTPNINPPNSNNSKQDSETNPNTNKFKSIPFPNNKNQKYNFNQPVGEENVQKENNQNLINMNNNNSNIFSKDYNNNSANYNVNYNSNNSNSNKVEINEYLVNLNNIKKISKGNNYNNSLNNNFDNESTLPEDEFSQYIFTKINNLRQNPSSFIPLLEKAKSNISKDKHGRLVYRTSFKVLLNEGKKAFDEAIDILRETQPMYSLIYRKEITVDVPNNEEDIKDKTFFLEQVKAKDEKGIFVQSYWREAIKDPEVCFVLMIVDDTGSNNGLKRRDILNPETKYIGISSVNIGKSFACYILLSPEI